MALFCSVGDMPLGRDIVMPWSTVWEMILADECTSSGEWSSSGVPLASRHTLKTSTPLSRVSKLVVSLSSSWGISGESRGIHIHYGNKR